MINILVSNEFAYVSIEQYKNKVLSNEFNRKSVRLFSSCTLDSCIMLDGGSMTLLLSLFRD